MERRILGEPKGNTTLLRTTSEWNTNRVTEGVTTQRPKKSALENETKVTSY